MQADKLKEERIVSILDAVRASPAPCRLSHIKEQTGLGERVLDHLLQTLRRQQVLSFDSKLGWRVAGAPATPPLAAE